MSVVSPRRETQGKVAKGSRLISPKQKHVKARRDKSFKLSEDDGVVRGDDKIRNKGRRKSVVAPLTLSMVGKDESTRGFNIRTMNSSRRTLDRDSLGKVSNAGYVTIVTFNVGNIWSDSDWNRNRWKEILHEIVDKDADVVILHEVMKESGEVFATLNDHGYKGCVPYISREHLGHKRDNWEVIFSKFQMHDPHYETLSSNDGLSCVHCVVEGHNNAKTEINICATTWSTLTRRDLERLSASTSHFLDPHICNVVSVSANKLGSFIIPPKGFSDVWTKLGSKAELEETLNKSICADFSVCNRRGDHIWVSGASPEDMSILVVENGAEHNGLISKIKLRTCGQPYVKSYNNKPMSVGNKTLHARNSHRSTSMVMSFNGKKVVDSIDLSSSVDRKYRRNSISIESPRHCGENANPFRDSSMNSSTDNVHPHRERKIHMLSPRRDVGTIIRHRSIKNISDTNQCLIM